LYDKSKRYKITQEDINVHLTKMIQLSERWIWSSEMRGNEAASLCFRDGSQRWGLALDAAGHHFLRHTTNSVIGGSYRALPVRSGK
jgi:hypothetical protein